MANNTWTQPQRQPAKALIYVFYKTLLTVLKVFAPLLISLLFKDTKKQQNIWEYTAMLIPVLALIAAVVRYRFFKFFINDKQQLVVQRGLFNRRQIILPLEKVQAVNVQQQWLHRLANLSELTFDSPGSTGQEAKITLTTPQANALKQYILAVKNTGYVATNQTVQQPEIKTNRLYDLDPVSLMKLGLTANHIETFFIVLAFGYSLLQNIRTASSDYYDKSVNLLSSYAVYNSVLGVLIIALVVIAVSVIISFIRTVLQYANFSIASVGNRFQIRTGLINTKEVLVPFSKVQYISWRANWLRTKAKMYLLQFHSIGQLQMKEKQKVKVPLTRFEYLPQMLEHYHPLLSNDTPAVKVHPAYVTRKYILVILPLLLVILTVAYFNAFFYWALVLLVYNAVSIYLFRQKFALRFNEQALYIQRGSFGNDELILLWHKIQSVSINQSIYQRKNGLATIHINTAGGGISIPYVTLATANKIVNFALYKTETQAWQ